MLINARGNNEEVVKTTLARHFIGETAYACMLTEDFDGFVESRANEMLNYLKNGIGIRVNVVTDLSEEEQILSEDDMTDQ